MTKEEAIKEIKSWDFLEGKEIEAIHTLIPELAESEDERIRKLVVNRVRTATEMTESLRELLLSYLEKQKEQKPENKEITLTNFEEILNTFLFDFANSPIEDCEPKEYTKKHSAEILKAAYTELNAQIKQDIFEATQEGRREGYEVAKAEQKPAEWSDTDNIGWDEAFACVTRAEKAAKNEEELQNAVTAEKWLKEIKFKYCVHPVKQEWSEEDERMLSRCIKSVECSKQFADSESYKAAKDVEMNWLKSLKNRGNSPKSNTNSPSWKPSEEQMREYSYWYRNFIKSGLASPSSKAVTVLGELLEQLEKL